MLVSLESVQAEPVRGPGLQTVAHVAGGLFCSYENSVWSLRVLLVTARGSRSKRVPFKKPARVRICLNM